MRLIVGVVAFLGVVACEPEPEPEDSAEPYVAPLAPAWVAATGSTYAGAFKSTCTISGSIADTSGGSPTSFELAPADGGQWAGVLLPEGQQVKGTITWTDCENTGDGTGTFESNTFSGEPGDLFVLHYDGVDAGFEWMVQGTDHLSGEVHVQFDPEADDEAVEALIADLGASARADSEDATFSYVAWTEARSVAEVLGALSESELFLWGEPTWVAKPAWW